MESNGREASIVTVELCSQHILNVRWAPGAIVRETDARALKNRVAELSLGRSLPMLVEMAAMEWIDRRAMAIFAAPWPLARMALLGECPVDEVIARFYTARHNHACPTQFFTSRDEAMGWLTKG